MKYTILIFTIMLFLGGISKISYAQCPIGQVEVSFQIITDDYAMEGYWELVPVGNVCGVGTITSGGNTVQLNCTSGGTPITSSIGNGYNDNTTVNVPFTCLTQGGQYDIKYIDDYGDGGFIFRVKVNGYIIKQFTGSGSTHTFTFTANEPPNFDIASSKYDNTTLLQKNYVINGTPLNLKLKAFNWGKQTISSMKFNYQVNAGSIVNNTITGLSLLNYSDTILTSTMPFSSTTNGNYTIKMWYSDFNGSNVDSIHSNDTTTKFVTVGNDIPNIISSYIGYFVKDTTIVNSANQVSTPTDIDFHPNLSRNEMWVLNRNTEAIGGTSVIVSNTGTATQTSVYKEDGNNWHFMSLPTAMAFGENENFGTSPGVFDANHNGGTPFTGPSLWTSDLAIYGGPASGNGDHLDMLHESPYSQGIAWDNENVYWVFDGYNNDIVRYDFAQDHEPGQDYHGDAIIRRYADFAVAKDPNDMIPSHVVLDKEKKWLYIVDHGNKRVMRINIQTGIVGGIPIWGPHETTHEYSMVTGYTYETVVSAGLDKPCGIDVIDKRMIVTDYATNQVIFYDITTMPAVELYRVTVPNTNGIMGIKIGPDGKLYMTDYGNNRVIKIEPTTPNALNEIEENSTITVTPNPSSDIVNIQHSTNVSINKIILSDINGRILNTYLSVDKINITNLAAGQYMLTVQTSNRTKIFKILKK
ncbi:MAG: T9SS type A sorting domain-containing protein [Bacteroidetes bacterium]|nr:T9SS type A sorting domain-containing protein [Bacteroidota bacterium]